MTVGAKKIQELRVECLDEEQAGSDGEKDQPYYLSTKAQIS